MNINDFTQFFDNPAVSVFNRSKPVSFPMKIGAFYPAKWELLSFGNSQKSRSAHSLRLAPLVAPTYANMQFQDISAIVPLRTILSDYEVRFNYAVHRDGQQLPCWNVDQYMTILRAMLKCGVNPVGSLLDFLGYPVYADVYKSIDWSGNFNAEYSVDDSTFYLSVFDSVPYRYIVNTLTEFSSLITSFSVSYRDYVLNGDRFYTFIVWLALKTYGSFGTNNTNTIINNLRRFYSSIPGALNPDGSISTTYTPSLDDLINASVFKTSKEAIEQYKLYLFSYVLESYFNDSYPVDQPYSTLPLRAFWRFHYDWNINGNFVNRDDQLERWVFSFDQEIFDHANYIDSGSAAYRQEFIEHLTVPYRLWNDDFFTSLLPTSTVDNAVEIPANSTVLDLAKLTAWQKFVMRLSYSSRYRDVVWNIFKIKPSDATLVQSYPIFRNYDNIGIGEVNQTSSSDVSGVLGGFAGRGYSAGRNKGYSIFCEEPCIVFDFVSIMPKSVYADALHPLIHVDDILDFPLPDMDVLGNQPIYADLVSGNPEDHEVVLGYGRQYQEWLTNYGTVHGDFKTTLDYWQIARRFSDTPVVNDDFLRIHPADDLDVIFSLQDSSHAFVDLYFDAKVTRHVHRNVRIKI